MRAKIAAVTTIERAVWNGDGCVFRVITQDGKKLYAKAVTTQWDGELRTALALPNLVGGLFQAAVVAYSQRRVFVMNDFAKSIRDRFRHDTKDLQPYNQLQETRAAVLKERVPLRTELKALGVPVKDGAWLQKKTLDIVNDMEFVDVGVKRRREK